MNQALKLALALAILLAAATASAQDASSTEARAEQAQAELDQATGAAPAAAADQPAAAALDQPVEPVAEGEVPKTEDAGVPRSVALLTGGDTGAERSFPLGGLVLFDQSVGVGTFVADKYARNPYYAMVLSLRPKYYFTNQLTLEGRFDLSAELTKSFTSTTTAPRQVMPSDLFFTLRYQNAYQGKYTGDIGISPFLRIAAPTSFESRYRNQYLSLGVGFDLSRMIGEHVFLGYTLRASKYFNRTTTATVTGPVAVARSRGAEDMGSGEVSTGTPNVEWSLLDSLVGSYIINDQWSVSLSLSIINSWTYDVSPADRQTSANAKTGRGQRDETWGVLDVSYQPWEHVGFSLGLSSRQPAKTEDNSAFRFPFFDFRSLANNFTNLYFDVYATF